MDCSKPTILYKFMLPLITSILLHFLIVIFLFTTFKNIKENYPSRSSQIYTIEVLPAVFEMVNNDQHPDNNTAHDEHTPSLHEIKPIVPRIERAKVIVDEKKQVNNVSKKTISEKTVKRKKNDSKPVMNDNKTALLNKNSSDNLVANQSSKTFATTNNARNADYLSLIRREIDKNKHYPMLSRRKRSEGVVTIRFNLSPEGKANSPTILKSSGDKRLDDAAIAAVMRSKSVGMRPEGINTILTIDISFKLH